MNPQTVISRIQKTQKELQEIADKMLTRRSVIGASGSAETNHPQPAFEATKSYNPDYLTQQLTASSLAMSGAAEPPDPSERAQVHALYQVLLQQQAEISADRERLNSLSKQVQEQRAENEALRRENYREHERADKLHAQLSEIQRAMPTVADFAVAAQRHEHNIALLVYFVHQCGKRLNYVESNILLTRKLVARQHMTWMEMIEDYEKRIAKVVSANGLVSEYYYCFLNKARN